MGFDLDRSEMRNDSAAEDPPLPGVSAGAADQSGFSRALRRNMLAERFAIEAYRKIAEHGENYDEATLRLVKVALAVEEEHAEILSALMQNLRGLNGALAG